MQKKIPNGYGENYNIKDAETYFRKRDVDTKKVWTTNFCDEKSLGEENCEE